MMSWNSLIFCWNNSRVGNAISDSSLIGVPSCFSGGRRIVKCTRSTLASDFRRLRQVRSPECGSPETRSTRSLSRTPSIATTAPLLNSVRSFSSGGASLSPIFERRTLDLDDIRACMLDVDVDIDGLAADNGTFVDGFAIDAHRDLGALAG